MCLIIDNDVVRDILASQCSPAFTPIKEAIHSGQAVVVYGGKLKIEYIKSRHVAEELMVLDRLGLARQISDQVVDRETTIVRALSICKSNDQHIIALARVSGARLLCSHDQNLHSDFGNRSLINNPRGSVYQDASHASLIGKHCKKRKKTTRPNRASLKLGGNL